MSHSPSSYVDPFIGVDGGGNCLCGPYLPLSLVRLGPDTRIPQQSSGYSSRDPIIRFSHNHVSGTGGGGRYGNIGITPGSGRISAFPREYERGEESASVGYYRARLDPAGILAELTSTARTGVHRYTFPDGAEAFIIVDTGSVVQILGQPGADQGISIGGFFEYISDTEIVGRSDCKGGWGHSFPYSVYFYLQSSVPFTSKLSARGDAICHQTRLEEANAKAVAGFGRARTVELRVGISYISIANARRSVEQESASKSFEQIRAEAVATWDRVLQRIRVVGGSEDDLTMLYTMLYRLYCMPSDLGTDDEMPMWRSGVRHFTDYYCLWDSVRNANSLITLLDPKLEVDMLNCLLDVADRIGWIPDAWIAFHGAHVQGGSSADVLLSEAARKGLPGIDYVRALERMRKNNEVESPP
jgi:predicted alpha-1,2-mannosidase